MDFVGKNLGFVIGYGLGLIWDEELKVSMGFYVLKILKKKTEKRKLKDRRKRSADKFVTQSTTNQGFDFNTNLMQPNYLKTLPKAPSSTQDILGFYPKRRECLNFINFMVFKIHLRSLNVMPLGIQGK